MLPGLAKWLGNAAANAVKFLVQAAGVVGWLIASAVLSALVTTAGTRGQLTSASALFRLACVLAPPAALLAASVYMRRPARWLAELGLSLGFTSALIFAALTYGVWLFVDDADKAAYFGGVFLMSAELGVELWAIAAWRHWDNALSAWMKLRRYVNGTRASGKDRNCFQCAFEPLYPFLLLISGLRAAFDPAVTAHRVWARLCDFIADNGAGFSVHLKSAASITMPSILSTHRFWLGASSLRGLLLYVALRRIGVGRARRGFVVWLFSLGEIGGGFILSLELFIQINARLLNDRLESAAVVLVAAGLTWFCRRRRHLLLGWRSDPVFGH